MKVDEMVAGPEIDALAAEKVMERTDVCKCLTTSSLSAHNFINGELECLSCLKEKTLQYSKHLSYAWELMDKIPGTGYLYKNYEGKYQATTHSATVEGHAGFMYTAMAETPALAIVRVTLKRMGMK